MVYAGTCNQIIQSKLLVLMKMLFIIILTQLSLLSFSQEIYTATHLNNKTLKEPLTLNELAQKLTSPYHQEIDKVRSIFIWIADNISYNVRPRYNPENTYEDVNDTGALKPLSERVAEGVLKKRIAFCDGYARLFKTLCDYAGITSELITGFAKTNNNLKKADPVFRSNHRWNAVMIDSTWRLLDVTWASGYISGSNEFVRHLDDRYFLSHPKDFIRDHYPEDVIWTLLPSPPSFKDYYNMR